MPGERLFDLNQDKNNWRELVNMILKFGVPYMGAISWLVI